MNNGSTLNKLITPEELAEILRISKASVYRLIDSRKLPFYKVRGSIRFKNEDIEEYLESFRFEPIIK